MRLIDSTTYDLREFYEKQIPRYAILSHRWEEDGEVTFQDLQAGRGSEMSGWAKVEGCCRQASKDGWRYCWIDSCCIDKTSSAELSEAINSMFEWYRRAEVCYAYLSDVDTKKANNYAIEQDFKKSAWFTRGWTLQELLAPQWVEFYDIKWQEIGTKSSLAPLIKSITGISHLFNYAEASIAQKMCWASLRQTTRIEDQAYCLLGIFGVHMPPLYGEGTNAFHRLQMEIISQSDDESIFAWEGRSNITAGLLASSPRQFQFSGDIVRTDFESRRQPYSMTNQGLCLELLLEEKPCKSGDRREFSEPSETKTYIAPLNCSWKSGSGYLASRYVGIVLCTKWAHLGVPARDWVRRGKLERYDGARKVDLLRRTIFAELSKPAPVFSRPQCVIVKLSTPWEPPFTVRRRFDPPSDASWSTDRSEGEVLKSFYKSDDLAALMYQDNTSTFAIVLGSAAFVFWIDIIVDEALLQKMDAFPEQVLTSLVKPDISQGGGDRILKKLPDGRVVSALSKKELRAAAYRFVVDVAVSGSGKARPGDLEFARFHLGELALDGAFHW
ncbi:heterokaryon incompatibility protein-domain-containing protein [Rhexocercosporidium sp. MPI-PUGE-AT-0058]|nr:heterokaryon incompatibility protein-domain-containing protein [Rhexocercosporidium sp. MPI-PUGE-AT-0058]